jgi:hypothetical protein
MSDPPLVFPVGQAGGRFDEGHVVRRGAEVLTLVDDQHTLWSVAHSAIDRTRLLAAGTKRGVDDAQARLAELAELRLLVEVARDGAGAVAFAETHTLAPSALGLGNTADQPALFGLGFPPRPWLTVPERLWRLWCEGDLHPSLWAACTAVATADGADPRRFLTDVFDRLHALLWAQTCYLDAVAAV